MASIRRVLSPVPRPGSLMNGEACQSSSPLSKPSSNSQNYPSHSGLLDHVLGLLSQRSSRTKLKGQIWRRAFLHFSMCFLVGAFLGLSPFSPTMNMSLNNVVSKQQVFDFEPPQPPAKNETLGDSISSNENPPPEQETLGQAYNVASDKLLIVVTPTLGGLLQVHYLSRLAHTLRLVPHPVLWIVVEMNTQSVEIAELLRNTGVFMYRHLVCIRKNSTGITDKSALLRNVAISHIETHRLDGIVYFADDDRIYSTEIFVGMRKISRVGTWAVAKLEASRGEIFLEGPVCNGSQVMGWHVGGTKKRFRRFHADMSGFAFNSTMLWDTMTWHRPTIEPIRQLETVKEDMQASAFIEQVVQDESQMECFSIDTSVIMVWLHDTDSHSNHRNWFTSNNNSGSIVPFL